MGNSQQALHLFTDLQQSSVEADAITYNAAAISACEKGQQWQQVLHLFQDLQQNSLEADAITYNVAISACDKLQCCDQCMREGATVAACIACVQGPAAEQP